jgi:hypothetical protein
MPAFTAIVAPVDVLIWLFQSGSGGSSPPRRAAIWEQFEPGAEVLLLGVSPVRCTISLALFWLKEYRLSPEVQRIRSSSPG